MMCTSTPDRDVGRRRAEEDEEAFTGSSSKKTPPKKTAVSDRWNHYTFRSVLAEVAAYEAWMRDERGLSEKTICIYRSTVDRFLDWLAIREVVLALAKTTDIDQFIEDMTTGRDYGRVTIRGYLQRLRAFFRFAEQRGWCVHGIAASCVSPRVYQDRRVPNGLSREDVRRLLATTEGDRPINQRDRAILMLLIAYGLRAGEVCRLQLDDVNWEEETLRVRRSKSGRMDLFPLSRGVGHAVVRYVRNVRPARPERALFFTMTAPIRALAQNSLSSMVHNRMVRLGIVAKRRGAHVLRHSAAQQLLDHGMSLKVIGDYLGHRSSSATSVYARVDLSALREVAEVNLEGLA